MSQICLISLVIETQDGQHSIKKSGLCAFDTSSRGFYDFPRVPSSVDRGIQ